MSENRKDMLIFFLGSILILIFFQSIISENFLMPLVILLGSLIFLEIIKRPFSGLIILAFGSYALPSGLSFSGVSPGIAITAITLFAALVHVLINGKINQFSKIWYLIFFMLIYSIFVLFKSPNGSWFSIYNFIQGVTPFLLFSILVKNEKEARKIIISWLIAFSLFSIMHLFNGAITSPSEFLLRSLAESRSNQLSGFNPNVLAWTGLLYLPLAPSIAYSLENKKERLKWWIVFYAIVLLLVFLFSRAGMIGMIASFFLITIFSIKQSNIKNKLFLILPLIIGFLILYFIWEYSINRGWFSTARLITTTTLIPAIQERWDWIATGWKMIAIKPWDGWGMNISYGSHSGFTKAALEYGLIYFFMLCIPYIYILFNSFIISKYHHDNKTKLFSSGILVAGIVAVIQGVFGATMFAAGYAQVFWLFIGYLSIAKKEIL